MANLQRQARKQKLDVELCGLTPRGRLVCLSVYILSGFELDSAAAYLKDSRRSRKRSLSEEVLQADVPETIRQWFRELSLECLFDLQDGKHVGVQAEAQKFVAKWRTAAWVSQQNYDVGVAPTYDKVARKYHAELDAQDLGHVAQRLVDSAAGDQKQSWAGRLARAWCGRFCRQFAIGRRSLPLRVDVPLAELEEKASWRSCDFLCQLLGFPIQFRLSQVRFIQLPMRVYFGPQNGPHFGTQNRHHFWTQNGRHFWTQNKSFSGANFEHFVLLFFFTTRAYRSIYP